MPIHFTAPGQRLRRTTGMPSLASDFTVMFWFQNDAPPPPSTDYRTLQALLVADDYSTGYMFAGESNGTGDVGVEPGGVGVWADTDYVSVPDATWTHLAYTWERAFTRVTAFINGVQTATQAVIDISTQVWLSEILGSDFFNSYTDFSISEVREWQAKLTAAEIQNEMNSHGVMRLANLLTNSPLPSITDLRDLARGNNWTITGTPVTAPSAPAPSGSVTITSHTCCGDSPGGPGTPGAPSGDPNKVPDPAGPLPAWTSSCLGGGLVPTIADLAAGESWCN